ncbi:MAG: FeoA family protein [Pseudomonadota bacterium]
MMSKPKTLTDVPARSHVHIEGFTPDTSHELRERLLAYGLIPGQHIRVLAQKPVTVLQIEHTELALEKVLAACVLVKKQA